MPRTAISILLAVLYLLILSCGNPFDYRSKEGTLRIVCTPADESVSVVRADLIVSNASGDPVATAELDMSGKTATGSVSVKAGSGYRVDVYGYDSSNNLSFFGSESDITVAAGKTLATFI